MARLFPNRLSSRVSHEVARAFRTLKKLSDEFSVHHSFSEVREFSESALPDFLIFWKKRYGFIIKIATTSQKLAESAIQRSLFTSEKTIMPDDLGTEEKASLVNFADKLPTDFPLRRLILFPNVSLNTIDTITLQRNSTDTISFLGLNQLSLDDFSKHLTKLASQALIDSQILQIRHHFSPEIKIPNSFMSSREIDRKTEPTLTPTLLDLDQEWCLKNQLYLPPENEHSNELQGAQTRLITGVAGSGKSLILIYRASILSSIKPSRRILLLTHNRPILNELKRRLAELSPSHNKVQCLTFFQWSAYNIGSWPERTISPVETLQLLQDFQAHPFKASFLSEEIGRIKDHSFTKKTQYLEADRTGWGKPLQRSQREAVWSIFSRYQRHLEANQLIDWHGVAMRFHQAVISGKTEIVPYDDILIDEAQFFAKAWFDIVRKALKPSGQLFLSADPTQGFLKRRQSWLASGIEVRGRTTRLHRAYRNTRSILGFAARFFAARHRENPEINPESFHLPSIAQLQKITQEGTPPEIIHCPTLQDTNLRTANEILKLRRENLPNGQILILLADSSKLDSFQATLTSRLGNRQDIHNAKEGILPEHAFCQISTLNAATGLEAPIVFLLGLDHLLDREDDPHLTPDEKAELHASQTSLIYMALTRAGQKLVIFSNSHDRVQYLASL